MNIIRTKRAGNFNAFCLFFRLYPSSAHGDTDIMNLADSFWHLIKKKATKTLINIIYSPYGMYLVREESTDFGKKEAIDLARSTIIQCKKERLTITASVSYGEVTVVAHNLLGAITSTIVGRPLNDAHRIASVDCVIGKAVITPEIYELIKDKNDPYAKLFSENEIIGKIENKPGEYPYHEAQSIFYERKVRKQLRKNKGKKKARNCTYYENGKALLIDIALFTTKELEQMKKAVIDLWDCITLTATHFKLTLPKTDSHNKSGNIRLITAGDAVAIFSSSNEELLHFAEALRGAAKGGGKDPLSLHLGLAYDNLLKNRDYPIGPGLSLAEKAAGRVPVGVIGVHKSYLAQVSMGNETRAIFGRKLQPLSDRDYSFLIENDAIGSLEGILDRMGKAKHVCVISNKYLILRPKEGEVQKRMVKDIIRGLQENEERKYTYMLIDEKEEDNDNAKLEKLFKEATNETKITSRIRHKRVSPCNICCGSRLLSEHTQPHIVIWEKPHVNLNHNAAKESQESRVEGAIAIPLNTGDDFDIEYSRWIALEDTKAQAICTMINESLPEDDRQVCIDCSGRFKKTAM